MNSGVILSLDVDWLGDSLTADAASTDVVLQVNSALDFDEDFDEPRWLVLAGETTPREYVAVDMDANTVTLAAAVGGTGLEAGLPVVLWDPNVENGGARSLEYVANVRLSDGSGEVPCTLPSELVPQAGTDALVGASVTVDEDSLTIAEVHGREPKVDLTFGYMPSFAAFVAADVTIPDATWTTVTAWTAVKMDRTSLGFDGFLTALVDGEYDIRFGATFASNSVGNRGIRMQFRDLFGGIVTSREVKVAADGIVAIETAQFRRMAAGTAVAFQVRQSSTADLVLQGSNPFVAQPTTEAQVRWAGPL